MKSRTPFPKTALHKQDMSTPAGQAGLCDAEAAAEIAALVSDISFTDRRADLRSGSQWTVYVHPWPTASPDLFDALLAITPRSLEVGSAHGMRLCLHRDNITWLSDEEADARGQIWFRNLPCGSFRVAMASVPTPRTALANEAGLASGVFGVLREDDALAAQSDAQVSHAGVDPRWRLFRPADRRLKALLEENPDTGRSTLLLTTGFPDLAGASVSYAFGEQQGSAKLRWANDAQQWCSHVALAGSFPDLAAALPLIVISVGTDG